MAFALGTGLCALGLLMLTHLGLITGQTAGLAVLISYLTGWGFSAVFFVVNLPFYALAWLRMGARFTVKSFIAVAMLSAMTAILPQQFVIAQLSPLPGVLLFAACTGVGLLVLFRHGGSLGGIGVLGLYLQDRTGFRAGWTQLIFDAILFAVAFLVLPVDRVAWSLLGAVVINVMIAMNHRKDRYIAT
nr:YitT family protein [Actibacterium ureilyticum]